jgi:hypothetical protein
VETELRHQDAIIAYFDSAGRDVTVLQCPDFESFIADNNLMYGDVLFILDLPRYIIPEGIRILAANYNNESPRHNWLPEPPDLSNFGPSSTSRSSHSQRSHPLLSRNKSPVAVRPDPEGFDPQFAPVQHIHMGRRIFVGGSHGGVSPLTFHGSGSKRGASSIAVGSRNAGNMGGALPPPLFDILRISTMASQITPFFPLAQPEDASSAISILGDSSSDPPPPALKPSAVTPPVLFIKDKASNLGIKDVTDKETWTEAKKIIDARLRRHPYSPGPDTKLIITMTSNAVASAWWDQSQISSSRNLNSIEKDLK